MYKLVYSLSHKGLDLVGSCVTTSKSKQIKDTVRHYMFVPKQNPITLLTTIIAYAGCHIKALLAFGGIESHHNVRAMIKSCKLVMDENSNNQQVNLYRVKKDTDVRGKVTLRCALRSEHNSSTRYFPQLQDGLEFSINNRATAPLTTESKLNYAS